MEINKHVVYLKLIDKRRLFIHVLDHLTNQTSFTPVIFGAVVVL
jgi:hypothetical protein